jgi:LysR family hydrogen peroxide-inducible transcriptional activator
VYIHQLRYFLAVAELGSFSKAAASCYVSQPALSIQIQKLETELEQRLLNRTIGRITVTEAGRLLEVRAKRILADLESAKREVQSVDKTSAGLVTFGVLPTIAPYFLPAVLQDFRESTPNIGFSIHEENTSRLLQMVKDQHLDFALACPPVKERGFEIEKLLSEEWLLALSPQNSLSSKNQIQMEDLHSENFILLNEGNFLSDQILAFCNRHKLGSKNMIRTGQISTVLSLVQAGIGVSLIPQMAASANVAKLAYRSLEKTPPKRTVAVVRTKKYQAKIAVEKFLEHLRSWKPKETPDKGDFAVGL